MQYKIQVPLDSTLDALLTALSEELSVSLDAAALAAIRAQSDDAAHEYRLSVGGHVQVQMSRNPDTPGSAWLIIDANRHRIKSARTVVESWSGKADAA